MVINIENIDHLFVNEDISGSKKFDDAKFIITNILQELLEENNKSLVVNMKNLIAVSYTHLIRNWRLQRTAQSRIGQFRTA